jgi:hypothetical protein
MDGRSVSMRWTKALAGAAVVMGAANAAHASVEISSAPTSGITCSAGVCAPTAKKAVLNATDLANMLAASDVKVTTGSGAVTITVTSSFSWTSASRLTLDAAQNVSFQAPVTVAGPGAVTIVTNDGGSGGQLIFFVNGKLDFWSLTSSLVINGSSYTLVGDVATLAGDVASSPAGMFALANDYTAKPNKKYKGAAIKTPLDGNFDGLGHAISNLRMGDTPCDGTEIGLFSVIDQSGAVRDLHMDSVHIATKRPHAVGGIAGASSGTIANVWVSGSIATMAGEAGHCQGASAGGIVGGGSFSGAIYNAHSSASVTMGLINIYSNSAAGGLAGFAGHVDLSSATGIVDAPGATAAGGLAGGADTVTRSFATGAAYAGSGGSDSSGGGLVGEGGNISNSYSLGDPGSEGCTGGFMGYGDHITNSYSTGTATSGFLGCDGGSDADDYWDIDSSGTSKGCGDGVDCTGVTGLTDEQLKSALPPGFDKTIWARSKTINNGYPYLIDNPPQ